MSDEQGSPVPGAADAGSVSERSAQRAAIATPRTPRQWGPASQEPDQALTLQDQDGDLIAYNADEARGSVGWRYTWIDGHEMYYGGVPWSDLDDEFTVSWPLSEVLPETPEPPQDWQPKPGERVIAKLFSHPDDDIEGEFVGHRSDFVSNLNVGAALWCAVLRATLRPAASQSVPAVPESSTGGADSGEDASEAQRAFERDLADILHDNPTLFVYTDAQSTAARVMEHFLSAGWQPPLPEVMYDAGETAEEAVRRLAAEVVGLRQQLSSPLPDSDQRGVWQSRDGVHLAVEANDGELEWLECDAVGGWLLRGMLDMVPDEWVRLVPLPDSETEKAIAELRRLAGQLDARGHQRDEIGDDDPSEDDTCAEEGLDCHTVAAVATWFRAALLLRRRADELSPAREVTS